MTKNSAPNFKQLQKIIGYQFALTPLILIGLMHSGMVAAVSSDTEIATWFLALSVVLLLFSPLILKWATNDAGSDLPTSSTVSPEQNSKQQRTNYAIFVVLLAMNEGSAVLSCIYFIFGGNLNYASAVCLLAAVSMLLALSRIE